MCLKIHIHKSYSCIFWDSLNRGTLKCPPVLVWAHTPSYIYADGMTHSRSDMSVSKRVIERKGRAPEPVAACDRGTLRPDRVTFLSGRSSRSISSGWLPWSTGHPPSSPRNVSDSTSRYFPPLVFCTLVPLASGWVLNTLWVLMWLSLCFKPSPWWSRPCSSLGAHPLLVSLPWPPLTFFPCFVFLRNFHDYSINHSLFLFVHLIYCLSPPPDESQHDDDSLSFFFFFSFNSFILVFGPVPRENLVLN